MTHLVGTVLVGQVESEFSNNLGSSLNAQQTSNLATLTNLKGQVANQVLAGTVYPPASNPTGIHRIIEKVSVLEGWLSQGRSTYIEGFEGMHNEYIKDQSTLISPLKQIFEQMESFNYTTLEFE